MPARVKKIRHDENTRAKIQAGNILHRLQAYFFDQIDPETKQPVKLNPIQVTIGLALLKKTLPDLTSVEINQEISITRVIRAPASIKTPEEWAQTYVPPQHRTEH